MKRFRQFKNLFIFLGIFLFFFFISATDTFAANRYWVGGTDGADYNSTSNWASADPASCTGGGASVPGSSDAVILDADCDNGITISGNWTVSTVSIAAGYGGTITHNTGTTWTVNSTFTNSGSASVYSGSGTATVKLDNTGRAPTITTGGITFNNLTLYTGESYSTEATTFADNFTVAGNLAVSSVSTCCTTHTWSAGSAKTITLQGNYTQSYSGTVSIFGNSNLTLMMTGANKSFTITGGTYAGNLTIDGTGTTTISKAGSATGGTFTASSTVALTGNSTFYNFNIKTGITFDASNDGGVTSYNTTINNNMTNQTGAIFTGRSGTVTFSHTNVSPTITTGGVTFNNVVMTSSDSNGTYSTTIADSFTVAGNLTTQLVSGSSGTHTWVGASSLKTITLQGNYSQSLSGSNSSFTFGNSFIAITMTGTDKTISAPSGTFAGTMNINPASGSIALAANSTLSGTFAIKSGKTFDTSPNSGGNVYNLTIKNTMTNESGAVFTARTGTVTFDHSGVSPTITTAGITFNNVVLTSGTGENSQNLTTTFADNFTIAGNLTVQSVAATNSTHTWSAGSAKTITVQGNYAQSQSSGASTVFGNSNLTLSFGGANDQTFTITSGTFSAKVDVNKSGGTVNLGTKTIATTFTHTAGTSTGTITMTGSTVLNGGAMTGSLTAQSARITSNGGDFSGLALTLTGTSEYIMGSSLTVASLTISKTHANTVNLINNFNLTVVGTTTLTDGTLSGDGTNYNGYITAQGNVVIGATWDNAQCYGSLRFGGANDQTVTASATTFCSSVYINKSGGTLNVGTWTFGSSVGQLYLQAGTTTGNLTISSGRTNYTAGDVSGLSLTLTGNSEYITGTSFTVANLTISKTHANWVDLANSLNLTVTGTTTLTDGTLSGDGTNYNGYITAQGNVVIGANWDNAQCYGSLRFGGANNQTVTASAAFCSPVYFSKTGGVLSGSLNASSIGTGIIYTTGDISGLNLTVSGGNSIIDLVSGGSGAATIASLVVNKTTTNTFGINAGDVLTVTGATTLTDGTFNYGVTYTGILQVEGDVTIASTYDNAAQAYGGFRFAGTGNQNFSSAITWVANVSVTKTAGTITNTSNIALTTSAITVPSGATWDLNGYNFAPSGGYTMASGSTLKLKGSEVTVTTPTLSTGSNVMYYGTTATSTIKNWSYKSLEINSASTTNVFSFPAGLTISTTTITSGVLNLAGYNATTTVLVNDSKLKLQGNESLVITTMDTDSGTVEYAGRNIAENLNIKDFGTSDYYNLIVNDTNVNKATFVAPATFRINGTLTVTSGGFDGASSALTLGGTNQALSFVATTTLASLTKSVTSADTLTFSNSTTTPLIITGTTTLSGAADNLLSLVSSNPGTQWVFDPQGGRDFSYLDVTDSWNINAVQIDSGAITGFVDGGNNTGWGASNAVITVSKSGVQTATTSMPVTDQELGGAFTLNATGGAPEITAIKIKQIGSLATTSITNVELFYKEEATCSATSTPLDATSFGVAEAFDENGIATTTGSLTLTDGVQTCLYIQYDLPDTYASSTLGRSIDFEITNPATDITVDGGAVTTSGKINITGRTVVTTTDVISMLSLKTGPEAGDVTVFYLQNDAVWKMVNGGTPTRLTNSNLKVHSLSFTDLTVGSDLRTVQIQMVISNVDQGAPDSYLNVTRTYTTTATVKTWGGN